MNEFSIAHVLPTVPQVHRAEFRYRYEERLGILTEGVPETFEQIQIAMEEAREWLKTEETLEAARKLTH